MGSRPALGTLPAPPPPPRASPSPSPATDHRGRVWRGRAKRGVGRAGGGCRVRSEPLRVPYHPARRPARRRASITDPSRCASCSSLRPWCSSTRPTPPCRCSRRSCATRDTRSRRRIVAGPGATPVFAHRRIGDPAAPCAESSKASADLPRSGTFWLTRLAFAPPWRTPCCSCKDALRIWRRTSPPPQSARGTALRRFARARRRRSSRGHRPPPRQLVPGRDRGCRARRPRRALRAGPLRRAPGRRRRRFRSAGRRARSTADASGFGGWTSWRSKPSRRIAQVSSD